MSSSPFRTVSNLMPRLRESALLQRVGPELVRGSTRAVARRLLGKLLVHDTPHGRLVGRIVETEAYLAKDPASHSFRGETARNASMFGERGTAYVYRSYGVHWCLNVVTNRPGVGEAVLLRALEPVEGLEWMGELRGRGRARELCSGPGKLTQAFGVDDAYDGADLLRGALGLWSDGSRGPRVVVGPRIGISQGTEAPLRFGVAQSPWLSRSFA